MSLDGVRVKEEIEIEIDLGQETGTQLGTGNEIICEVEVGPELLQAPGVSSVFPDVTEEGTHVMVKKEYDVPVQSVQYIGYDLKVLKSCSVQLERLPKKLLEKYRKRKRRRRRDSGPWICEFCKHISNNSGQRNRHLKGHVKQLLYNNDENVAANFGYIIKEDIDAEAEEREFKLYTCEVCRQYFFTGFHFNNHMKTHEEPEFNTASKQIEKKPQTQRYSDFFAISSNKEHSYFCISCSTMMRVDFDTFARHLLIHINKKPLLKKILRDFVLSDPIKRYCDNLYGKMYTCNLCNYMSARECFFRKHIKDHILYKNSIYIPMAMKAYSRVNTSEAKQTISQPTNDEPSNTGSSLLARALTTKQSQQEIYKEVTNMKDHVADTNCSPIAMKVYSRVKASDTYRIVETKLKNPQPTNHQQINQCLTNELSLLAHAFTSDQDQQEINKEVRPTEVKSSNESIDFQKSSLFSRLKLLNQVVGKS